MSEQKEASSEEVGFIIGGLIFLSGLAVIGWQIFNYMKDGIWNSVSIITAMQYFGNKWSLNPVEWTGLWNTLEFIPLSITLIVFGILLSTAD